MTLVANILNAVHSTQTRQKFRQASLRKRHSMRSEKTYAMDIGSGLKYEVKFIGAMEGATVDSA